MIPAIHVTSFRAYQKNDFKGLTCWVAHFDLNANTSSRPCGNFTSLVCGASFSSDVSGISTFKDISETGADFLGEASKSSEDGGGP